MKHLLSCILCLSVVLLASCDQMNRPIFNLFSSEDYKPPVLVSTACPNPNTITLKFDEEINIRQLFVDAIEQHTYHCDNSQLTINLKQPLLLGRSVELEASITDKRGNSSRLTLPIWSINPHPASLLINEFSTKGTESNPDRVELLVTARGNLAGLTLYNGSGPTSEDRCVLPDQWVEEGTYLVVRFSKSSKATGEFVSQRLGGLSSNNGCLALCLNPNWESTILDAVVWGNPQTSTFEGFGSENLMQQVKVLQKSHAWNSDLSTESVDSTLTTSTRTFCRTTLCDTNSAADWYICATRQSSFGSINTETKAQ